MNPKKTKQSEEMSPSENTDFLKHVYAILRSFRIVFWPLRTAQNFSYNFLHFSAPPSRRFYVSSSIDQSSIDWLICRSIDCFILQFAYNRDSALIWAMVSVNSKPWIISKICRSESSSPRGFSIQSLKTSKPGSIPDNRTTGKLHHVQN